MKMPDITPIIQFDGCGISAGGQRVLTAERKYWDDPKFQALGKAIAATPDTLAALAAVLQSVTAERESIGVAVVSIESLKQARASLVKAGVQF